MKADRTRVPAVSLYSLALPWLTDELVLIAPPAHRLTRKKILKRDDLAKETFISCELGGIIYLTDHGLAY